MIDTATTAGRLLTAALDLAGSKDWAAVTLIDIAEAAGASLAELRAVFTTKSDVIAALIDAVDAELLRRTPKRAEGQESRDLLFDAVMTRFDLLAPYKRALKSIYATGAHGLPASGVRGDENGAAQAQPKASRPTLGTPDESGQQAKAVPQRAI